MRIPSIYNGNPNEWEQTFAIDDVWLCDLCACYKCVDFDSKVEVGSREEGFIIICEDCEYEKGKK